MKLKIIYEDECILVCHKPAGLATQTAKIGQQDMVSELKNYLAHNMQKMTQKKQAPYLGIIHRLDQPVEGILVFAKSRESAASLTKQLLNGNLNKRYYAVTCGQPPQFSAVLVDYLIKDSSKGISKAVTNLNPLPKDAKEAILEYRQLQQISTPAQLFLMDIHIQTGRFHQIRVQMAHSGMSLLGDFKYGEQNHELSKQLGIKDVALCAYRVDFMHPLTKKKMEFEIKPQGTSFQFFSYFMN